MRGVFLAACLMVVFGCGQNQAVATENEAEVVAVKTDAPTWVVDYDKSRLGFSATQNGNRFDGEFEKFKARILLDPDKPETGAIDVRVDMTSAEAGDRQRNAALPGGDWFKAKEFPFARFVSSEIVSDSEGRFAAKGDLTIRDVTKEIILPFALKIEGDNAIAVGEVTLVRSEFGVGRGEFSEGKWVSLDVLVRVEIAATKK